MLLFATAVLSVVAALTVLGVLIGVTFGVRVGEVQPSSLATSGPAATGFATLRHDGFPTGLLDPVEVLVPDGENLAALARRLSGLPGAYTVVAPAGSSWRRDGTALLDVVPHAAKRRREIPRLLGRSVTNCRRSRRHAAATGDSLIELDWLHVLYGARVINLLFVAAREPARARHCVPFHRSGVKGTRTGRVLDRSDDGRAGPLLAARLRVPAVLGHPCDRRDRRLRSARDLCLPLRTVDGL